MNGLSSYHAVHDAHVGLVVASVSLFAVRGLGVLSGSSWPMHRVVRHASVSIDSLLLAAGGVLWWMLALNPARDAWLLAKLTLLVMYVVLGSLALKRARAKRARAIAFVSALCCVAAIATIALNHDPLAPLRWLTGLHQ